MASYRHWAFLHLQALKVLNLAQGLAQLNALRIANLQTLHLAWGTETETSVGTRHRPQALDLALLQALVLANIQVLVLAQRVAEIDTSVGTRRRPQAHGSPTGTGTGKHTGTWPDTNRYGVLHFCRR